MEYRDALPVDQVLQRAALPVEAEVVTGFESQVNEALCLRPGERIRVHGTRYEMVFIGITEVDQQTFILPLQSANQLEVLPELPELDDRVFPTVRDVLEAAPRPTWIRAQESYDGGHDYNTVHEGEEFQNFYIGKTYRGEPCMRCNIIQNQEMEDTSLVLDTRAMFTTTRGPRMYLTAADFARTCDAGDELAVRVRIHWVKTHKRETPQLPFKAKLLRLTEQRTAVCTCTARGGRIFLLPSSLTAVSLRLRRRLIPFQAEDLTTPLYSKMDVLHLPRIGPPPLSSIFIPFADDSQPPAKPHACAFKQLAVLFSPVLSGLATSHTYTGHNTATYCSLTASGIVRKASRATTSRAATTVSRDALKKVGSLGEENYLKRHCDLSNAFSFVSRLLSTSYSGATLEDEDRETPDYEEVANIDDCDEVWFKDVSYEEEFKSPEKIPTIYDFSRSSTHSEHCYDLPKMRRPLKTIFDQFEQTEQLEGNVTKFRKENEVLKELIKDRRLRVETIQKRIHRCLALAVQKNRNTDDEAKLLQSLSTTDVTALLCNLGFSAYVDRFCEEKIEGYLLSGCDIEDLRDLGMRPAHAQKLLAVLKGRTPLGSTLTDLIQKTFVF